MHIKKKWLTGAGRLNSPSLRPKRQGEGYRGKDKTLEGHCIGTMAKKFPSLHSL